MDGADAVICLVIIVFRIIVFAGKRNRTLYKQQHFPLDEIEDQRREYMAQRRCAHHNLLTPPLHYLAPTRRRKPTSERKQKVKRKGKPTPDSVARHRTGRR